MFIQSIPYIFLEAGFPDVTFKYLGGFHFLIIFPDEESAKKCILVPLIANHFKSLIPWNSVPNRLSWISIEGVPQSAWFSETFNQIAEIWGEPVLPEDCNPRMFNRAVGKVCIKTTNQNFIQEVVTISINGGNEYKIRVKEIDTLFNFSYVESTCEKEDSDDYGSFWASDEEKESGNNLNSPATTKEKDNFSPATTSNSGSVNFPFWGKVAVTLRSTKIQESVPPICPHLQRCLIVETPRSPPYSNTSFSAYLFWAP